MEARSAVRPDASTLSSEHSTAVPPAFRDLSRIARSVWKEAAPWNSSE